MPSTHQSEYNICYEPQWFYYYFDSLAKSSPQLVLRHSLNYREFYLTPMWASSWEELRLDNGSEHDEKYLKLYGRVAKINTGLSYEPNFDKNARDFARFFNISQSVPQK